MSRYSGHDEVHIFLNHAETGFSPLYSDAADCVLARSALRRITDDEDGLSTRIEDLAYVGDLDGDGRAELVTQEKIEPKKSGMRASLRDAKRPRYTFRFYRLQDDLHIEGEPYEQIETEGYSFEANFGAARFSQFIDLDDDGYTDLITTTLDFSMFQVLKAMATKRMTVGLNFHVWSQHEDGRFHKVQGLDLSEKLRLNFKKLRIGSLAQFQGDYDGDGRTDFVHFGRGKQITIHRGQPGCGYPEKPDLVLELEEQPQDLELIRVADYDGDGRSDFSILRLLETEDRDASAPVRIDFYLSGTP
jgi:hypothetical protein